MKIENTENTIIISLENRDFIDEEIISKEEIEGMLIGKGYDISLTNEQVASLNNKEEVEIPLQSSEEENYNVNTQEEQHQKKSFDGKGIYGENISSRFEFLNRGTEKVWEVLADYLDRGYLITNLVIARQWCSYRCDFSFRNGEVYRDVYKVRGEEIELLRMIANDSYPDKTGCDGRRVLSKSIIKLDDGALGLKLSVYEEKGPIELKIVMDKIY